VVNSRYPCNQIVELEEDKAMVQAAEDEPLALVQVAEDEDEPLSQAAQDEPLG
jgi:hypothetical protein